MEGIKHIIECHCVLSQYRALPQTVYHKFTVFSEIDDSDTVVPKYVQCNNCGVIHKIYDICKSEIMTGKEDLASVTTIDDIKLMIPNDLEHVLSSYSCSIDTWEYAQFILNEEKWGTFIVLDRDVHDDEIHGKILRFVGPRKFKIESFTDRTTVTRGKSND